MSGEGRQVCVTGASGYIASWLVKFLLLRGYTVKATVRDPNDPKKTEHLFALEGAKERLHLFKAHLLEKGSFDSVVEGCVGVFHTASPVALFADDPQTDLIDPAVKGTLNVLESCAKVPSIKRVVLTSSMASITFNGKPLNPDTMVDETWFSDIGYCEKMKNWYIVSKTLAEDVAIRFAEENGIDLVILNPGLVIGPLLQSTLNFSVETILNLVNGVHYHAVVHYPLVDVRDTAYAHIYAFEVPTANGRNLLVNRVIRSCEILEILRQHYPTLDLPQKQIVRALQYACITRPDLSFFVNKVCQFMHTPKETHWVAVKRILRYLKGTSTSVTWSAKKQPIVARSSTEAEYKSASSIATELIWIQGLLGELGAKCSKHIELDHHFIRERVLHNLLAVGHVPSSEQVADILTKPLSSPRFDYLKSKLLVRTPSA